MPPQHSPFLYGFIPIDVVFEAMGVFAGICLFSLVFSVFRRYQLLEQQLLEASIRIARNIATEKKHIEDLEHSFSLLNATLESTFDGILVVDLEGKITRFNHRFVELWGLPEKIINGGNDDAALAFVMDQLAEPDQFVKKVKELYAMPGAESHDILRFKNGRVFERDSRPQLLKDKIVGRVWSFRDITEKQSAENQAHLYAARLKSLADVSRQLAEAKLNFGDVLDTATKQVAAHFQDGCIIRLFSDDHLNLKTLSYHHVDSMAYDLMKAVLPDANIFIDPSATAQLLETGLPVRISHLSLVEAKNRIKPEFWHVLDRFPVHSWVMVPLRVGGRITGTVSVIRYGPKPAYSAEDQEYLQDVADRAALAIDNAHLFSEVERAVAVREEFMAIASHELKTPLTPLKLQLQLLGRMLKAPIPVEAKEERLKNVIYQSDQQIIRLTRLIEDMLDATSLSTGHMALKRERVELSSLVSNVIERFHDQIQSAGCEVQFEADDVFFGDWDRLRVEQVVINLLSNAMKFGAKKPIYVSITKQHNQVSLSVQDSGIGIAQEDMKRVFERFERAVPVGRFSGLGLGLYIAKQIVELHQGTIRVVSDPGAGAKFIVQLPLQADQAEGSIGLTCTLLQDSGQGLATADSKI